MEDSEEVKDKVEEEEEEEGTEGEEHSECKNYGLMQYPTGAIGIRQKFGKKRQICQVRKKGTGAESLRALAEEGVAKLALGCSELETKMWLKSRLEELA